MDDPRYDLPPLGGALDELPDFLKPRSGASPGTVIARLFELESKVDGLTERVSRLEKIVGVMK